MKYYINSNSVTEIKANYLSVDFTNDDLCIDIDVAINIMQDDRVFGAKQGPTQEFTTEKRNLFKAVANRIREIIIQDSHLVLIKFSDSESTYTQKVNKDKTSVYTSESNACYYTIIARTDEHLIMNRWGINLRLHDHPNKHQATRDSKTTEVLNGDNNYDYEFHAENPDDYIYNISIKFSVNSISGRKFTLRQNSQYINVGRMTFNSEFDTKLDDYIHSILDQLWSITTDTCSSFDYRGYNIYYAGNNKYYSSGVPVYNDCEHAVVIDTLRSVIDNLKGSLSNAERYIFCSNNTTITSVESNNVHILEDIADTVIDELNGMCNSGKWFMWTDIHFECDYQVVVIDILDSDSCRISVETMINDTSDLLYSENIEIIVRCLIEDALGAYMDSDFFDWDYER